MDVLLTVKQVAERLQVEEESVRRWLRDGKIEGVKAGSDWRISESALAAFLYLKKS